MNLLLISGGRHPYEESTPILENFLREAGHSVEVRWDTDALDELNSLAAYDALVFNTLRYGETALTKLQQDNVSNFIFNGKSFICIHISGCAPEAGRNTAISQAEDGPWVRVFIHHTDNSPLQ